MDSLISLVDKESAEKDYTHFEESEKLIGINEIKEIRVSSYSEYHSMSWAGGETYVDATLTIIGKDDTVLKECVTFGRGCGLFFYDEKSKGNSLKMPTIIFE